MTPNDPHEKNASLIHELIKNVPIQKLVCCHDIFTFLFNPAQNIQNIFGSRIKQKRNHESVELFMARRLSVNMINARHHNMKAL